MLAQVNAQLLSVTRGGFTEDYDRPAGDIAPVWQGSIDAYVQRDIISTFNDRGELRRVLRVTLFVDGEMPMSLQAGDIVVYQTEDPTNPQTMTGRIQNITDPAYLAQLPDYFKCALEEINAP